MTKPNQALAYGLYPETDLKPTGIEWIEEIPQHWTTLPLKFVATYRTSTVDKKAQHDEINVRLCNYTDVYYRDRIKAEGEYMEATASSNEYSKFKLLVGDTVITKDSEDWRDIAVPALVEETANDFVCGYHLGIIRPSPSVNPAFMFYTIKSTATNQQMQVASSGVTRYGLPNPAVKNAAIAIPPVSEQRAIAAFLDRETSRIDQLVDKHELQIERLAEYRNAAITQAVTKGLPPNAARDARLNPEPCLKPSGVEWIGDVPEHWDLKRLKQSATRTNIKAETEELGDIAYIGLENVRPWVGSLEIIDDPIEPEGTANVFQPGDVLFSKLRPYLAKGLLPSNPGVCSTEFLVITPTDYEGRYLLYLILTGGFIQAVNASTFGAKMPRTDWEFIGNQNLPVPPAAEQQAIVEYLDQKTARIDTLSECAGTAIERLNEYRTALITAAVTGKIDVQESGSAAEPTE